MPSTASGGLWPARRGPKAAPAAAAPTKGWVRFGNVDENTGRRIDGRRARLPALPREQRQHQIVTAQQRGVVAERSAHEQRQRQQHERQERRAVFLRAAQSGPAQRRIGQQVAQPPGIQAAERAKAQQPRQRHAQRAGHKRQHKEADRLVQRRGGFAGFAKVGGEAVRYALDAAVLAILFERIARRIVGRFLAGIGVFAHTGRGVRVDPRAGEGFHQAGDVLGVGPRIVEVEAAERDRIGAQVVVGFIGRLQRRVCKRKQRPAQKDARRTARRKAGQAAHQRGRRHDQHAETGAAERGPNSGQAAVQIKEHPPAVGPHNAQRRSGRHSQPPAQHRAARRGQPGPEALFVRRRHRMYCPTL